MNSIPGRILSLLNSINNEKTNLPSFVDNPHEFKYNDNICQLIQDGVYSAVNYNFANKNNPTFCLGLEGSLLTQGFSAALNRYTSTASQLYNNNRQTATYTNAQIQTYLSNTFFTTTVDLVDYLNLHLNWVLLKIKDTVDSK